jgi:hypothetical protein
MSDDTKSSIQGLSKLTMAFGTPFLLTPASQKAIEQEISRENAIHRVFLCCENRAQSDTLSNLFDELSLTTYRIKAIGDELMAGRKMPQELIDELLQEMRLD